MKLKTKLSRKIAKTHFFFSLSLFILYLLLSLVYSPEFLLSDVRSKFRALADEIIVVTAKVLGPPAKPVVTAEAVCKNGALSVNLDWADDENSESFDIERDGLLLVTNLVNSQYKDTNVLTNTSYIYTVIARGQMDPGMEISDPIVVTTPEVCEVILPDPVVQIISFAGKNIVDYHGIPETSARRPIFSGTTNIANAEISFLINGSTVIFAKTSANANGYWSWRPPIDLGFGKSTIMITAVDPLDQTRTASDSLTFQIVKKGKQEKDEDKKKKDEDEKKVMKPSLPTDQPPKIFPPLIQTPEVPLDFLLTLETNNVFQGKKLETIIQITKLDARLEGMEVVVRYSIINERGEKKASFLEENILAKGKIIQKDISIPAFYQSGKYYLQAEIVFECYNISRGKYFQVLELPILNLGGGLIITYPDLLSKLGLIASILIILLLLWIILFYREYRLQLRALRHITEFHLEKLGFFGLKKRKGVSR